jgi:glucose/arabinose dehydrogenase
MLTDLTFVCIMRKSVLILVLFAVSFTYAQRAEMLKLPAGFSSQVVFDGLPGARHMAVNAKGGIYIKLSKLKDGAGIIYIVPSGNDGKYTQKAAFGNYPGTGIAIKDGYLYASSNDDVFRYKLDKNGEVIDTGKPEKIIAGLVNRNRDNAKSIALDNKGNIYVNVGSYIGSCLIDPKSRIAPQPCPLLDSVGGIWQFKAGKTKQGYAEAVHFATGFKHVVGLDWNSKSNSLFIMQHGRDQLNDLYPALYTAEQNSMIPAETMYEVRKGADGGWPYVYYDQFQKKQILSPEYGGDGKKEGTHPALAPKVAFPAHLAPNGMLFYTGKSFPSKYRNGAFVAFHGNSPELKKGYFVGFVPFDGSRPAGDWEVFADNFTTSKEQHKPCGLAQSANGDVFVSDDAKGNIYLISYKP